VARRIEQTAARIGTICQSFRAICHSATYRRFQTGDSLSPGSLAAVVAANLLIFGQDMLMFFGVDPGSGSLYFTADFAVETVPAYKFLFVPQAWTLGVELLFYLVAPLIVTRRMKTIFIVFTLGLELRWYIMIRLGLQTDPWDYRFFPIELPLFLWGSLAYKAYAHLEARKLLNRSVGATALGLIFAGVLFNTELPTMLREGVLGLPIMCIALGPALPFLFHRTRYSERDRWVGALSYPIYIVHLMVVMLLR
jgi:peptidoglycan/LPS O-acetylase OafA/YrhL